MEGKSVSEAKALLIQRMTENARRRYDDGGERGNGGN